MGGEAGRAVGAVLPGWADRGSHLSAKTPHNQHLAGQQAAARPQRASKHRYAASRKQGTPEGVGAADRLAQRAQLVGAAVGWRHCARHECREATNGEMLRDRAGAAGLPGLPDRQPRAAQSVQRGAACSQNGLLTWRTPGGALLLRLHPRQLAGTHRLADLAGASKLHGGEGGVLLVKEGRCGAGGQEKVCTIGIPDRWHTNHVRAATPMLCLRCVHAPIQLHRRGAPPDKSIKLPMDRLLNMPAPPRLPPPPPRPPPPPWCTGASGLWVAGWSAE